MGGTPMPTWCSPTSKGGGSSGPRIPPAARGCRLGLLRGRLGITPHSREDLRSGEKLLCALSGWQASFLWGFSTGELRGP